MSVCNITCPVCGGKGGFRKIKKDMYDTNWTDCLYCNRYGFIEDKTSEDECRDYLIYENYKSKIINELSNVASVDTYISDIIGKDLYIKISVEPKERNKWVNLVKTLLKFSHYSKTVDIIPKQVFFYTEEGNHHIYWELNISMLSLKDLEGLYDIIKMYNTTL
ncbi:MAG: hypothetical protein ABS939_10830 [Psychrobacillus sp.]